MLIRIASNELAEFVVGESRGIGFVPGTLVHLELSEGSIVGALDAGDVALEFGESVAGFGEHGGGHALFGGVGLGAFEEGHIEEGVFDAVSAIETPAALGHLADEKFFVRTDGVEFLVVGIEQRLEP